MDAMLYGPGDIRNAHKPNEYVPIQSLLDAVKAVVVTAMRFCGYTLRERPMADRPGR
jgi:acetylornithine deacetylase